MDVELRRVRRRRARRRPRGRRREPVRSRPEPVALQRLVGVRVGPSSGSGRGVHRARDLPTGRAALRQGDRARGTPRRPARAGTRRFHPLAVQGSRGRDAQGNRRAAQRVRHVEPAVRDPARGAARRLRRGGRDPVERQVAAGGAHGVSRRRVPPAGVSRRPHRHRRAEIPRGHGARDGAGALPVRRADGARGGAVAGAAHDRIVMGAEHPEHGRLRRGRDGLVVGG